MFFSIFISMWFTCGLFVGAVAGWNAFDGKFGLIMNLLITIAPTTLMMSLLGISIGARYSLGLGFAFIAVSLIKGDAGIAKCLLVGVAGGISAFSLIVAIELFERALEALKNTAEEVKYLMKNAFLWLKNYIAICKNRLAKIKIQQ